MTAQEKKARALAKAQTLENLVEAFELTDGIHNLDVSTVRGWLMAELEARNPEAFEKWLDSNEDSPRKFYL